MKKSYVILNVLKDIMGPMRNTSTGHIQSADFTLVPVYSCIKNWCKLSLVVGSCKFSNEHSGSTKCGEFLNFTNSISRGCFTISGLFKCPINEWMN
jgi:hypothetical protein